MPAPAPPARLDAEALARTAALVSRLRAEVARAYVGSPATLDLLLTALVARGHVLLEGVPGVAKTTLVKALARTLGTSFRRIQFTPDLLPSDITGTYVLDVRTGAFTLRRGPVFAQVVLGDEINRAPAKTQAALLEAMQENQVTIDGETHALAPPFLVLATQNPIEHQGTYPLPEAQLDRFLVRIAVGYPSAEDEKAMLLAYSAPREEPRQVMGPEEVLALQSLAEAVHTDEEIVEYVVALVRRTREHAQVTVGASPRAGLGLLHAARARALLAGRDYVLPDDVKRLAESVLAHRIVVGQEAELDGWTAARVVAETIARLPLVRARAT